MRNTTYTNDPYFQITEYEIPVEGLERDITIFHMSDLHVIVSVENSTEAWKASAAKQKEAWAGTRIDFARHYGDDYGEEHLIQPEDALSKYIDLVNQKKPDALLMTGDMLNEYSDENIRFLADAFRNIQIPWMWVRGNHEVGHDEAYAPYTQGNAVVQTLRLGNLVLLGMDDSRRSMTAEQTGALEAAVEDAKANGCVPVLTMHIPIKTPLNAEKTAHFDPYFLLGGEGTNDESQAFLDYLQSDDCAVRAILCGHVHGHHISEYADGKHQICCSSSMVGACVLLRFVRKA